MKELSYWFNFIKKEQDANVFLDNLEKEIKELKMTGTISTTSAATSPLFNNKTVNRRLKRGKKKKTTKES